MSFTFFYISSSPEMASELSLLPFCGVFSSCSFVTNEGEGNWHSVWHVYIFVLQNKVVFIVMTVIISLLFDDKIFLFPRKI